MSSLADEMAAADQHQPGGPPVLPAAHHRGHGGVLVDRSVRVAAREAAPAEGDPFGCRCQAPRGPLLHRPASRPVAAGAQLGDELASSGAVTVGGGHARMVHAPFDGLIPRT